MPFEEKKGEKEKKKTAFGYTYPTKSTE